MSIPPPTAPDEPSNRWPWVALVLGLLVVAVAVVLFFVNRGNTVNINVEGTPTPNPLARASTASPGPPPTLVPPTLPASATLAPSPTPVPPSPSAAPTQPPPTVPPPPPTQAAAAPTPGQAAAPPPTAQAAQATAPPAQPTAAPTTAPAAASPTPFTGQVANAGGLGNSRSDFDAAYGPPAGETSDHLVVYRKNNFEYHVAFTPDPSPRAWLVVVLPQQSSQPLPLQQAQAEAHRLLPKDAQPPNPTPEGNDQIAVERYTSQLLAQALPPEMFTTNKGQPGQMLIVYVKDAQGRITRWIAGPGNDPNALINQGH